MFWRVSGNIIIIATHASRKTKLNDHSGTVFITPGDYVRKGTSYKPRMVRTVANEKPKACLYIRMLAELLGDDP